MVAGRPTLQTAADRKALIELMDQCMEKPSVFAKVFLKMDMFPTNASYVDCKERFIVYRSGRQHGKTTSTAVKTIHFAYFAPMMHERVIDVCDIVIVAPTQNQANNMLDRIKTLIHRSELLTKNIKKETTSEIHLSFANGKGTSRIYTRAAGEQGTSVRGYSPHIIIADECSFLPENVIVALMPAGMATKVHVWLTSTPYSPVGFFYNACMNSRPTNPNGQWIEFHAKSTDSPLIKEDPNFLEQITKQLTKEQYKMEVEGEFLEIGDSFIPRKLIEEAMEEPKEPMVITRYYMGCDIARQGKDETVFQVIGVDRNDVVHLVETYSEAQSNLVDLAGTIQKYIEKYNIQMAYLDSSGVGAGLIDICNARNMRIRAVIMSLEEQEILYKNLRMLFENKRIFLHGASKTAYQLTYLKQKYTEGNKMRVTSEIPDDCADSLALACKAVESGNRIFILDAKGIFG